MHFNQYSRISYHPGSETVIQTFRKPLLRQKCNTYRTLKKPTDSYHYLHRNSNPFRILLEIPESIIINQVFVLGMPITAHHKAQRDFPTSV